MSERYPLEPAPDQMRAMGEAAVRLLERFVRDLPDAPAVDLDGAVGRAEEVRRPPPDRGRRFDEVLGQVWRAAEKGFNTAGPGYLAYIPGGGLYAAALGDFLASGLNRFVGLWTPAPALAQIEWTVLRWLGELFGYPESMRGILTSGGSMSNLSAIVTARVAQLGDDFLDGTMYVTDQTHASVTKAARLAGLPARSVRTVPTDRGLRMDVDAFRSMVKEDRDAGRRPFLVVPSAGTTNTGAVDPLAETAAVAEEEGLWAHVDGAYGGFFQLTERGRDRFRGIERADSITLDPHKAMFLPYGTGALLVRDGTLLRDAHAAEGDYLQDLGSEEEIPNFTEYSPELSRPFRGLSMWLPLQLHGVDAFRAALDEKLDLAGFVHLEIRAMPELEVPWEPELSVVAFRIAGGDDRRNAALLDRINGSRRVFLSSTRIGGRHWIRVCIVSHRTHRDRVEEAVDIIGAAARELRA
ncbi:MAG TPA: aminotransferase class I/II-fold pyridoxal phosphate-dependent enzyme [Actinomycetota bacterium]|nr:aminotransferase class I/II-fold pyridoxal phosphate-dependent enzyme [Actinomycetota bacterium]